MVYIEEWNKYQEAVEELYQNSPKATRYVTSWRYSEGKLILKVTDNFTVLKYKTDQASDLKKFERLNRSLMLKMQNRKTSEIDPASKIEDSSRAIEVQRASDVAENSSSTTKTTPNPQTSKKKGRKK
ncbi:8413_t:CDS:2 [Funneliformis geosporum]|uniref:19528_t:CDS:1 n=1 Tax=Funneliformis geosporum TaxID=1117311 RepID=A0A9W4T161_9GLOM|nr:19528_t:CDS:2 [Funneliformis geosporum]CAI2189110.1 8413_t:CDS:2 [Funneliformis geosporum]